MQVSNIKFFEHLFMDCFIKLLPDRGKANKIANPLLLISSLQNQKFKILLLFQTLNYFLTDAILCLALLLQ